MESQNGVARWSRKDELQVGVAKWSCKDGGHENQKFGGICNGYPKGSNRLIKNNVRNKYVV